MQVVTLDGALDERLRRQIPLVKHAVAIEGARTSWGPAGIMRCWQPWQMERCVRIYHQRSKRTAGIIDDIVANFVGLERGRLVRMIAVGYEVVRAKRQQQHVE